MKYKVEIEIERPIEQVIKLFDNTDNLYKWMDGLQNFEHISGTPGEPGAKSKLTFRKGTKEFSMTETITVKNLPEEFTGTYEIKGVFNVVVNRFKPLSENKTLFVSEQKFFFKGFMKLFAFLMKGAFKKQSMKILTSFKKFAENA